MFFKPCRISAKPLHRLELEVELNAYPPSNIWANRSNRIASYLNSKTTISLPQILFFLHILQSSSTVSDSFQMVFNNGEIEQYKIPTTIYLTMKV